LILGEFQRISRLLPHPAASQTLPMRCYMHPLFERHDPGRGHPERPERYAAVARAVAASGAEVVEATAAPRDALERVHDAAYLAAIERLAASGGGHLDPD